MIRNMFAGVCCSVAAALLLSGCHPSNPLVGKWQSKLTQLGHSASMTREFRADGTETITFGAGSAETQMTYTVDGQTLTENVTGMSIAGKQVAADSPQAPGGIPKNVKETFTLDGDKLTISSKENGVNINLTYDRVK